ncbi:MAG: class I SAM-dependent methyltransferase [Polyangiales bacterium]
MSEPRRGAGIDHELRVGSAAHYDDPAYYAKAYDDRVDDVAYYVALASKHGNEVLEYGCGSGRIALPLARAGADFFGIDLSAPMLAELEKKVATEPDDVRRHVRVRHGDMREVALKKRFPLVICTFNTLLHLYSREDVERFLARVRGHLAPGGVFVFDANVPTPFDLARDPGTAFKMPAFRHPTLGRRVRYAERFDYDPIRQILFVAMEFSPTIGEPFMTPLAHRQFFPEELGALLHYNDFDVEKREGGFKGEPVDRHADCIVWTCRDRRSRKR